MTTTAIEVGRIYRTNLSQPGGKVKVLSIETHWADSTRQVCFIKHIEFHPYGYKTGTLGYYYPEDLVPVCQECHHDLPDGAICGSCTKQQAAEANNHSLDNRRHTDVDQQTITLSFAINNDNGEWDYKVRRVDFADLIDANPYRGRPAQAEIKDGVLHIGYVSAKVLGRIGWFGSMVFEGVPVSIEDAQCIAEYLRERGYKPEYGIEEIWKAWDEGQPIVFPSTEVPSGLTE